jgi:hypothetical protein
MLRSTWDFAQNGAMSPTGHRASAAIVFALLVSCGAAPPVVTPPPARAVPPGPTPTVMYAPPAFFLRLDLATLRDTPIATELAALYRNAGLVIGLSGGEGFDPVAQLDAVASTTSTIRWTESGAASSRWRIALQHRATPQEARALLERSTTRHGELLEWHEHQGITSARLVSATMSLPHAIVLSGAHEAILAPEDELAEILPAIRDHEARRLEGEVVEPSLRFEEGLLAEGGSTSAPRMLEDLGATGFAGSARREPDGVRFSIRLDFPGSDAATAALDAIRAQARIAATNGLLVLLGIGGPLGRATFTPQGTAIVMETTATWDEVRAILRALAAME